MNVAWSQRYSSYKKWWKQKLATEYTVEFWQPIHKNFEDILDNNKQYIKLIQTESGLLLISSLISLWANISVPLPAVQKKRMILLSLSEQLFCVENNERHGHSSVNSLWTWFSKRSHPECKTNIFSICGNYLLHVKHIFFFQIILTSCSLMLCKKYTWMKYELMFMLATDIFFT